MSRPCGLVCVSRGLVLGVALLGSRPARAEDLRDVAARVEGAWRDAGGSVSRREARFIMEDESTTIDLRLPAALATSPSSEAGAPAAECVRVALIGARGMSFHVTPLLGGSDGTEDESAPIASTAGVVELHGCNVVPELVRLRSDSGRGALEVVVASSSRALPPVGAVLLERTGGVLPMAPEPGPLPPLLSPKVRAGAAEARLVAEGYVLAPEVTWTASDEGKGVAELMMGEGCHELALFAVEPRARGARRSRLDLDGALRRPDGEILVEDQSIAPDVRLDACFATATKVRATFEGAPRGSAVLVSHGVHVLPPHLPAAWPADVRARLAGALLLHHVLGAPDDAIALTRGASGATPVPVDVEPGGCYVAVAAMDRGAGRGHGVALRVVVGGRVAVDDEGARESAALVAFCAGDAAYARVDVDARSAAAGWSLAVFRVSGGAWSVGR